MSKYEYLTAGDILKLTVIWSKWQEVWSEIEKIGQGMHHNAKLRDFPYEGEDNDDFWDWLSFHVEQEIEALKEEVHETYGYFLEFYSTGRSGATIYPSPWCNAHHHYRGLDNSQFYFDDYWDEPLNAFLGSANDLYGGEDMITALEEDERKLKALKFIASTIESGVKGIPGAWQEELKYRKENE